MIQKKSKRGVTLVALVITVVVVFIIAGISGEVEIGGSHKGKKVVKIKDEEGNEETKHLIPHGKMLLVRNGDYVEAGIKA